MEAIKQILEEKQIPSRLHKKIIHILTTTYDGDLNQIQKSTLEQFVINAYLMIEKVQQ